jgi:ABC-type amino acid transport substrate-binding protein
MGFFGRSKQDTEKTFVDRAEQIAGSLQTELYSSCHRILLNRLPSELAGKVSAAIANHVCRFGYVNPDHLSNEALMRLVTTERQRTLAALSEPFKSNATGVLIMLAAAWKIDLEAFRTHLSSLAQEGFAKVGANAPDVRKEMPEQFHVYVFEASTLKPGIVGKQ